MYNFVFFFLFYCAAALSLFYYFVFRDFGQAGLNLDVFYYLLQKQLIFPLIKTSLAYMFPPALLAYILFSFRKTKAAHLYYAVVILSAEFVFAMSLIGLTQKAAAGIITDSVPVAENEAEQPDDEDQMQEDEKENIIFEANYVKLDEEDYSADNAKKLPEDETFFGKHYVHAAPELITAPEKKKNVILIFMESMEMTFGNSRMCGANLIPFLKETAADNLSFSGFTDGYATNWTQASLTAAMTGIPSSYLFDKTGPGKDVNAAGEKMNHWLNGVYSLGEIMRDNGYERLFVQGGSLEFSGTGKFLEEHGFEGKAYGTAELKDYGKTITSWGIEDKDIYGIFEDKLSKLPPDKPFFAVLATIDTHHYNEPDYVPKVFDMRSKDVIYYADSMIKDFLNRFYAQAYSKDTVLIIVGDHLRMSGGPKSGSGFLNKIPKEKRRIYNVFINPANENSSVRRKRELTQIDMFPTILEAAGFSIKGHRLGLGVSVFSEEKTLAEQYKKNELRHRLRRSGPLYGALWQ